MPSPTHPLSLLSFSPSYPPHGAPLLLHSHPSIPKFQQPTTAWEARPLGFLPHAQSLLQALRISPLALRVHNIPPCAPGPTGGQGGKPRFNWERAAGLKSDVLLPTPQSQLLGLALLLLPSPQRTHIFHSAGAQERLRVCLKDDDCLVSGVMVPQPSIHMA